MFYNLITKYTDIFCWKKWEKLLHCKSFSHFFNKKYWQNLDINIWKFNETLTNDILSFEKPGQKVNMTNMFGPIWILTPTLRNKSPTIFSADIRADGVRGVPPFRVGIPVNQTKHNNTDQNATNTLKLQISQNFGETIIIQL